MRGRCLHLGIDEHGAKKRSFAFSLAYIKCFRTHSVYLSFRHGVLILYTPRHLPPQREARQLPPHATDLPLCESFTLQTPHYFKFRIIRGLLPLIYRENSFYAT